MHTIYIYRQIDRQIYIQTYTYTDTYAYTDTDTDTYTYTHTYTYTYVCKLQGATIIMSDIPSLVDEIVQVADLLGGSML